MKMIGHMKMKMIGHMKMKMIGHMHEDLNNYKLFEPMKNLTKLIYFNMGGFQLAL